MLQPQRVHYVADHRNEEFGFEQAVHFGVVGIEARRSGHQACIRMLVD